MSRIFNQSKINKIRQVLLAAWERAKAVCMCDTLAWFLRRLNLLNFPTQKSSVKIQLFVAHHAVCLRAAVPLAVSLRLQTGTSWVSDSKVRQFLGRSGGLGFLARLSVLPLLAAAAFVLFFLSFRGWENNGRFITQASPIVSKLFLRTRACSSQPCGLLFKLLVPATICTKVPMQVRVLRPLSTANLVFSATFSHQHDNPPPPSHPGNAFCGEKSYIPTQHLFFWIGPSLVNYFSSYLGAKLWNE